ncbi:hypothetical protein VNO77_04076 [Canavalia gladiata]|uniref:Uncharacterized protein n=1 Tax=Canavalia gladiata TaxID=3824 RepID=A0AAN9MVV2_CANGL
MASQVDATQPKHGSIFSVMQGSLVTSSLIRKTRENEVANEGCRFGEEEETYNIVAAHGYFGWLIFQCANFNNFCSLLFFLAAACPFLDDDSSKAAKKRCKRRRPEPPKSRHMRNVDLDRTVQNKKSRTRDVFAV